MPLVQTTIDDLQIIAKSMNTEKVDEAPFKKIGVLVRVNSKAYTDRKEKNVILLDYIDFEDEQFAYFLA